MRTDLFDYVLPKPLIAVHPLRHRETARLLVLGDGDPEHRSVREWPDLVEPGSLVVLNDTRVIKARLLGRRVKTHGRIEILLLERVRYGPEGREEVWLALGRASKGLREGDELELGSLHGLVLERLQDGRLVVVLRAADSVQAAIDVEGHVPIPPYLAREDCRDDVERYQTVYARHSGSVAAPTAGLHLTEGLLARLCERGIETSFVTLHVGLGTFRPVSVADLDVHPMHSEQYEVSAETAAAVARARERKGRVVAVGTTVVRALESACDARHCGQVRATRARTELFIRPGYAFRVVDALLTNFHQPRSTLLALVCAFAGRHRVMSAYATAIAEGYRFLSYGDAMWLPQGVRGAARER